VAMVHAWKACGSNPSRVRVPPPPPMRIIFLNSWGGRVGSFDNFIKKYSSNTDVFCFQEVSPELFEKISLFLPDHEGVYEKGWNLRKNNIWYGQATFIKKGITITSSGRTQIFKSGRSSGFMQHISLKKEDTEFYVGNVHGKSHPWQKLDTGARLNQSRAIIDFFENKKEIKIIGGDFNLLPETRSIGMFEEKGFRNLIKSYGITNTRNRFAWDRWAKGSKKHRQYFADYIFISQEVKVKSFEVPYIEVSDHLPLILDFEI
jgi:exonuclease III